MQSGHYMHPDAQIWETMLNIMDNPNKNEKFVEDLAKLQKQMMGEKCEKITPELQRS